VPNKKYCDDDSYIIISYIEEIEKEQIVDNEVVKKNEKIVLHRAHEAENLLHCLRHHYLDHKTMLVVDCDSSSQQFIPVQDRYEYICKFELVFAS